MDQKLKKKLQQIKLLALDFDGVLTDGTVYVDQEGREMVRCSRRDSMGILLLKKHGIDVVVVSKETNPVVAIRCKKMGVRCIQGINDGSGKREALRTYMKEKGFTADDVAYMGDDVNDIAVDDAVGVMISVADGYELLCNIASYVTHARGGEHAVREVCEMILQAKGIHPIF